MAAGAVVFEMEKGVTNEQSTIYVGIDVSKDKLAVAIAGGERRDDVLSLGTFEIGHWSR